ncbi:MAG TPA: GNAT family N-acetyltransferase [Flavobacterium sp.]|nr:GNAT family N-acetyltransferase [Flavobacterium sp.]
MEHKIYIKEVQNESDFKAAKELILEYVTWLGIDSDSKVIATLKSQNFDKEMNSLPETYGKNDGRLFIALTNGKVVGVAGIKRFNETECEVKRMYIQPESRGLGIGKLLLNSCIEMAKTLNYTSIKLDTTSYMKSAIKLYTENGFVEISAYRHNPHDQARFFELNLLK